LPVVGSGGGLSPGQVLFSSAPVADGDGTMVGDEAVTVGVAVALPDFSSSSPQATKTEARATAATAIRRDRSSAIADSLAGDT